MMKIFFPFLLLMFSINLAWAATPGISTEQSIFNFGEIAEGAKVDHTFRFKNTGDAPLVINKVSSSCGCTAALLSEDVVQPGASGEVKTTFDSKGFSGAVTKTIYLYTNDPRQSKAAFQLKGTVKKEISVHPARLRFNGMKADTPTRATITLINGGEKNLFLSDLKTTSQELTGNLSTNHLAPGEKAELEITVIPEEGKKRFSGYVTLRTSSPRNPLLRIPVTGSLTEAKPASER